MPSAWLGYRPESGWIGAGPRWTGWRLGQPGVPCSSAGRTSSAAGPSSPSGVAPAAGSRNSGSSGRPAGRSRSQAAPHARPGRACAAAAAGRRRRPTAAPSRRARGSRRAAGGEAPDDMSAHAERRPDVAGGWRIRNRLAGSASSASGTRATRATSRGSTDARPARVVPPGHHGDDEPVRRRQVQLGQRGHHAHAVRVDPGLLLGLAQRRPDRVVVARVDAAAGERRLPGVVAQVRGLLDAAAGPGRPGPRRTGSGRPSGGPTPTARACGAAAGSPRRCDQPGGSGQVVVRRGSAVLTAAPPGARRPARGARPPRSPGRPACTRARRRRRGSRCRAAR